VSAVLVAVDTAQLTQWAQFASKRLAYATLTALNRTGRDVQRLEFEHIKRVFVIRGPERERFFFGTIDRPGGAAGKMSRPTPARPYVELEIESRRQGGKGGPILLGGFEHGMTRRPHTPFAENVAVPLLGRPARPSINRPVPPAFTFAGMKLEAFRAGKRIRRRTRGGTRGVGLFGEFGHRVDLQRLHAEVAALRRDSTQSVQWKGRWGTFLLPQTRALPHGGVFQRIGPERGDIRLVWKFVPPFQLDDRLEYVAIAEREAGPLFRRHMEQQLAETFSREAAEILRRVA
jgi:hypothetical protein